MALPPPRHFSPTVAIVCASSFPHAGDSHLPPLSMVYCHYPSRWVEFLLEPRISPLFSLGGLFGSFDVKLFECGVIPRFTRRVESSSSFKLFFRLSWNGNIRRRGRQFLIYEREIGFVRVCLCILFRNSTGSWINNDRIYDAIVTELFLIIFLFFYNNIIFNWWIWKLINFVNIRVFWYSIPMKILNIYY